MAGADEAAERRKTAWMIYDYLSQEPLLLPLAVPAPDGDAIVEVPANEQALSNIAISVDPKSGTSALPFFLDAEALAARFPGCRFVRLPADKVLELFVASRYDALFYAIDGRWMSSSRDEAAYMLAVGREGRAGL